MNGLDGSLVRLATEDDVESVVRLANELFREVGHEAEGDLHAVARRLLASDATFLALLAFEGAEPVGLVSVSETCAVYAGGSFGCIHEFYVTPGRRSMGVGRTLLGELRRIGAARNWRRLEVTAAPRAVAFYRSNGFEDTGPRLKFVIENVT